MQFQSGFTLVEVLLVIGIASLISIFGVGTVLDYQKQSEVSTAVAQAREIAYVVDRLRRSDLGITVPPDEISLRQFRTDMQNIDTELPARHFAMLNTDERVLGVHFLDFYRIRANEYSVFVSFDLLIADYGDIRFDNAAGVHNVDSGWVTWTVIQNVKSGVFNTYAAMNEIYAN